MISRRTRIERSSDHHPLLRERDSRDRLFRKNFEKNFRLVQEILFRILLYLFRENNLLN